MSETVEHELTITGAGLGGGVGIGMISCSCGWSESWNGPKEAARDVIDNHRLEIYPNAKPWREREAEKLLTEQRLRSWP